MLAWVNWTLIFASSWNIEMNSSSSAMLGRMRLIATRRSKPPAPKTFPRQTSAMPPMLIRSSSRYRPKGIGCFFSEGLVKEGRIRKETAARKPSDRASGGSTRRGCAPSPQRTRAAPRGSLSLESRRPLLEERDHALLEILGGQEPELASYLFLQRLVEGGVARCIDGGLHGAMNQRWPRGEVPGEVAGRRHELLGREDAVGEADPVRLGGVDHLPGEHQLQRPAETDEPGEHPGAAAVWHEAPLDEDLPEAGPVGHEAQVAGQREVAPEARRRAVHHREGRQRAGANGPDEAVEVGPHPRLDVLGVHALLGGDP